MLTTSETVFQIVFQRSEMNVRVLLITSLTNWIEVCTRLQIKSQIGPITAMIVFQITVQISFRNSSPV